MGLMTQEECIRGAYGLLETVTPLRGDCGRLCGKACCKGDENTGMWLLPGEEKLLEHRKDFHVRTCQDNAGYPLAVCRGRCAREYRPFACRIYPLFPLVTPGKEGGLKITAIYDPRSTSNCLLTQYALGRYGSSVNSANPLEDSLSPYIATARRRGITPSFLIRLRKAGAMLLADQELRQYLLDTSRFLIELAELRQKVGVSPTLPRNL